MLAFTYSGRMFEELSDSAQQQEIRIRGSAMASGSIGSLALTLKIDVMKKPTKGQKVIVYDRYRFAIPLKGIVVALSTANDGVQLQLTESNSNMYPVGCDTVWVSRRQLRRDRS